VCTYAQIRCFAPSFFFLLLLVTLSATSLSFHDISITIVAPGHGYSLTLYFAHRYIIIIIINIPRGGIKNIEEIANFLNNATQINKVNNNKPKLHKYAAECESLAEWIYFELIPRYIGSANDMYVVDKGISVPSHEILFFFLHSQFCTFT
ncbi:hypothetical protein LissoIVSPER_00039, partial [Lissonota sp. PSUC_FEM 10030012]|nr:hypothetical protein [Lissonota sp. PSUC_FEM 10030012]